MKEELPVTEAIQKLKSKELNGKNLNPDLVLEIVECLRGQGYGTLTIAGVMGYSSRQVQRYLSKVKEKNSFKFSTKFWGAYIGGLIQKQEKALDYLIRTYHDAQNSPEIRIVACSNVLKYMSLCTQTLQSLGALPLQALKAKHQLYGEDSDNAETKTSSPGEAKEMCSDAELDQLKLLTPMQRNVIRLEIERLGGVAQEFIDKIVEDRKEALRRHAMENPQ